MRNQRNSSWCRKAAHRTLAIWWTRSRLSEMDRAFPSRSTGIWRLVRKYLIQEQALTKLIFLEKGHAEIFKLGRGRANFAKQYFDFFRSTKLTQASDCRRPNYHWTSSIWVLKSWRKNSSWERAKLRSWQVWGRRKCGTKMCSGKRISVNKF